VDFVLRAVNSPIARVIAGIVLLGLVVGATFLLLMPRNSHFVVQITGPNPTPAPPESAERSPLSQTPSPPSLPSPTPEASPTALPERSKVTVALQQAGASNDEFAKTRDLARSLGYTVHILPPVSSRLDRSVIAYPPGSRAVAERLASDLRPKAQLIENPSSNELVLSLGKT